MPTAFVKLICFCIFISLSLGAKAGGGAKSSAINRFSAQDTVNYWTTERMKTAIPRDVIRKDDGTHVRREIIQQDIQQMEEYFRKLPPAVHSPGKDSILFPTYSKEENHNSERDIVQQATDYSSFPWKAVGKIFFVLDGKNYVCSGAVLGKYVVATAGHCLQSDSMWAVNVTFVPAYNNRKRPFGTFSFHKLFASDEWVNTGKFCKDYGFAVMNKLGGHGVGDYVGYFGYSYNVRLNATHKWRSLGYPAAEPFNGENNYYVDGFFTHRETTSSCSPGTIYLRSDATGGASGGPWIHNFGSQNLLNGLNSYKHEGVFDSMFGPYFDTEWFNVMSQASSITPP